MQRLKQFLNIGLLVLILLSVGVGKVASDMLPVKETLK